MALPDIDTKTVMIAVAGSLTAYVFYGHIQLQATVESMKAKMEQMQSEQRDIWGKYNNELDQKVNFMQEYYNTRIEQEKQWTKFYMEK